MYIFFNLNHTMYVLYGYRIWGLDIQSICETLGRLFNIYAYYKSSTLAELNNEHKNRTIN